MTIDKESRRYLSILNALEDGIYVVKENYDIEFMNQAMVRVFGEGKGKKCYELIKGTKEKCEWCRSEEVFRGETLRREIYIPSVDRYYRLTELPLENEDMTLSKIGIYRDITRRKKSEARFEESEADYKRLFENVRSGLYVSSKEGKFLNANQALLDMLGYDSKEAFLEIDITRDLYTRPEDRDKFMDMIERYGYVMDYEVDFKRKDGRPIPVLMTSHVRYDRRGKVLGYEGIIVDQSQRKHMEKQLKEAHDFLNNIIRSSPNAVIATDMKGNILLWNRASEEIIGYKSDEVVGRMDISEIYPEGVAKQVMKMLRSPEYGGIGKLLFYPMVYRRRDEKIIEGNLSAAIIYDNQGKEIASVGVFVDLEERLEMERKLRETQEQLLQSEKLAAMGRLTSQIAHELNNPLYGIMNTLELLKTEVSPQSKRRKILEMALSETERLTGLLRKMLSFSKPDEEEKQPVDVNTIIDEILLLVKKQLQENSVKTSISYAPDLAEVFASKNQLRQVFLNMISNARDAMPEGGTLSVKTMQNEDTITIEISDTGVGIREENIHKIFDSFFTTKESVKGVGLGLSVCYGFIKEHGGDIKVSSRKGEGSTFTITLPVYKKDLEPAHTD